MSRVLAKPAILIITLYRQLISPLLGPRCRFQPTCSEYALQALQRYGLFKGGWLSFKRLIRCHPFDAGGYDPLV